MEFVNAKNLYVVKTNEKLQLYLGFAHMSNSNSNDIKFTAQNHLEFAFYFDTDREATNFMNNYLEANKDNINPKNLKYYHVENRIVADPTDLVDLTIDNINCKFNIAAYRNWKSNPNAFRV